jgi:hypothetical protein
MMGNATFHLSYEEVREAVTQHLKTKVLRDEWTANMVVASVAKDTEKSYGSTPGFVVELEIASGK